MNGKNIVDLAYWSTGLTLEGFVDSMGKHQAEMRRRLREVALSPDEQGLLNGVVGPLYTLALTEDWSGDSLMSLPILERIVEFAPAMELRIFRRSRARELNAAYEERGITHLPVFTFFDESFNEITSWSERSEAAYGRIAQWREEHRPRLAAIYHDRRLNEEARKEKLLEMTGVYLHEMEGWYREELQTATVQELSKLLLRASSMKLQPKHTNRAWQDNRWASHPRL